MTTEYEQMRADGTLEAATWLTYRCERNCPLLTVFDGRDGRMRTYQHGYTYSARLNAETTSPEAQTRNTRDGERQWLPREQLLSDLLEWPAGSLWLDLHCNHVRTAALAPRTVDLRARRARKSGRPRDAIITDAADTPDVTGIRGARPPQV